MTKRITVENDGHRTDPWVVKANGFVIYRTSSEAEAHRTSTNPIVIQQVNAGD